MSRGVESYSSVCYLDVGFVVKDGVREPKNYLRVTYDAPNPSFSDTRRTVGRYYTYEYLGNEDGGVPLTAWCLI